MGGKQSKNDCSRRSFNNDNPIQISQVAEHRAIGDAQTTDIIKGMQTDLQPGYRDVTTGYNIMKEGEAWRRKIDDLKKNHDAINKAMEREYEKAVQESSKMFRKAENIDPPCMELEALVMKCYRDNPNQTLMCAKYVSDYKKCVTNKRPTLKVKNP